MVKIIRENYMKKKTRVICLLLSVVFTLITACEITQTPEAAETTEAKSVAAIKNEESRSDDLHGLLNPLYFPDHAAERSLGEKPPSIAPEVVQYSKILDAYQEFYLNFAGSVSEGNKQKN